MLIGPNCPGLISPGKANVGIIPGEITKPGNVGLVSRSGTLTYQIMHELNLAGIGISTCVGIGGDPIIGSELPRRDPSALPTDPETEAIVFVGEIGGTEEQRVGKWIQSNIPDTPVVAYVAGFTAPARQADGPRRRHRQGGRRGRRDRRRQEGSPGGHGHLRRAPTRPRPPS